MKYQSRSYGNRLCKPLLCKHFVMNSIGDCTRKVFECYCEIAQRIQSIRLDTCNNFLKFPILEKFLNISKTTRHDPSINIDITLRIPPHLLEYQLIYGAWPFEQYQQDLGLGGGGYLRDYVRVVAGMDDEGGGGYLRDYVRVVGGTDDRDMPIEAVEQGMDANVPDKIDDVKGEQVPNQELRKITLNSGL
ncbi:hypothetical protein Tco_0013302 [Tanacetum coccineum]